ncbi:transcription initiation factor TFIID subunit A [Striga asiatica]|uniref:Transcription initiation factor TFIID subunit A n=1 Tax=Striga asiatica TaxID=4170 RepID=A0A5A7Q8C9_STRAF|nr:transcription initiation factor TFIID subunit A [Striga asiatica]
MPRVKKPVIKKKKRVVEASWRSTRKTTTSETPSTTATSDVEGDITQRTEPVETRTSPVPKKNSDAKVVVAEVTDDKVDSVPEIVVPSKSPKKSKKTKPSKLEGEKSKNLISCFPFLWLFIPLDLRIGDELAPSFKPLTLSGKKVKQKVPNFFKASDVTSVLDKIRCTTGYLVCQFGEKDS